MFCSSRYVLHNLVEVFIQFEDEETDYKRHFDDGTPYTFTTVYPKEVAFLKNPIFRRKFLPDIIKFIRDIYTDLSSKSNLKAIDADCNFILKFLKKFPYSILDPIQMESIRLEVALLYENFQEDFIDPYIYNPNNSISLADPIKAPQLFKYSLDLFNKPIIQDGRGGVYFSLLWLFDSLISKLTYHLRSPTIGLKRGALSEKYLMKLLDINFSILFPRLQPIEPFKLCFIAQEVYDDPVKYQNVSKIANLWDKLHSQHDIKTYKFHYAKTILNNRTYIDYDVCFVFHDTLFVIELKDNLFWDVRDLPDIMYMRRRYYEKKLSREIELLKLEPIQRDLETIGIYFNQIKELVVDHSHLNNTDFLNHKGLINYLAKFHKEFIEGEPIEIYFPIHPVKYPD